MSEIGRDYALEEAGFYVPLKGLLVRVVTELKVSPEEAGHVVKSGILGGTIAWREVRSENKRHNSIVRGPRAAAIVGIERMKRCIDWREGRWTDPDCELEVFWPDVRKAIGQPEQFQTIEGEIAPPAVALLESRRGGRPPKYDWPGLDAALAAKLYEEGCPAPGEQAALERWAACFFSSESQPAESQIRERVTKAILARKEMDAKA